MSERYVPKVGDKVRRQQWSAGLRIEVTAVTRDWVVGIDRSGVEGCYQRNGHEYGDWEPYVEPVVYPEGWSNVYRTWMSGSYPTRLLADRGAMQTEPRLSVLHLLPDGTTVMEAP